MLRQPRHMLRVLLVLFASTPVLALGQTTLDCERIDSGDQFTGLSGSYAKARSTAISCTYVTDADVDYIYDETYATISETSYAATAGNYGDATFQVTAEDAIAPNAVVSVPQITMGFGGTLTAHAVYNDACGWAQAAGGVNLLYPTLDFPGYAQGTFEVLGDSLDATLFGELNIIITFNGSGEWGVATGDSWQITCAGSQLTGVRAGDGWDVTGNLRSVGNTDLEVDEFWPDNVNEAIFVTELTESGAQHGLGIDIERMRMSAWGLSDALGGPNHSAVIGSFSFATYFEVEEEDP